MSNRQRAYFQSPALFTMYEVQRYVEHYDSRRGGTASFALPFLKEAPPQPKSNSLPFLKAKGKPGFVQIEPEFHPVDPFATNISKDAARNNPTYLRKGRRGALAVVKKGQRRVMKAIKGAASHVGRYPGRYAAGAVALAGAGAGAYYLMNRNKGSDRK